MAKKIDLNGLDHFKEKENAMIASEYSSSKTYAVGDYCYHAGTLYRCTTAITTAEAWTAGHWTAAKLADDTSELKTAFTQMDDKLLESVEPINIWNPDGIGYYNRYGTYYDSANSRYMFIDVTEGDVFRIYVWATYEGIQQYRASATMRLCAYNGEAAISSIDVSSASSYTVPSGVTKIALAINTAINTDPLVTINTETIPTTHQDYFIPYTAIKTDKTLTESNEIADAKVVGDKLEQLETKIGTFELIMPTMIPVVTGQQMNIYNDNAILGDIGNRNYIDYSVNNLGTVSKSLIKNLQINPTSTTTQTASMMVKDKTTAEIIDSKTFTINVIAPLSTAKKVIFIGDSLTDIGYYPAEIVHNLSNGVIESIGTRTRTVTINDEEITCANEGRGGWSPNDYVTSATIDSVTNAFWNPSTNSFDFSYYMSSNSFTSVDCVCIALGTNGVADTEDCVNAISEMIDSIHNYNSNIIVIVSLITPGATQNGWGNMNHTASGDTFKYNQLTLIKAYKDAFENKITNVYVNPWYLNIDTENDFPTEQYALSSRNPTVVTMQNNNVHPSLYGYLKMADVLWATLSYYLS